MKYPFTRKYLKQMNLSELQDACNNRKYSSHGTRSQLKNRLLDGDIDKPHVPGWINETNHRDDFQNPSDIIIGKNAFLPIIPPILYIVMLWVSLYNINNYIQTGLNSS